MQVINNFNYGKINLNNYQRRLNELLTNEQLKNLNIKHTILGKTHYNYGIDCITIGHGNKELFIVGGIHGSEIISTDFILNFINNLPNITEFNPNEIKLVIIPLQNPEGFDISTNTMKEITETNFTNTSYEYFFKYKVDSLMTNIFKNLTTLFENRYTDPNGENRLIALKNFITTNSHWLYITKLLPNLKDFNNLILSLDQQTLNKENILYHFALYIEIKNICDKLILKNPSNFKEETFNFFLLELNNLISTIFLLEITNLNLSDRLANKLYINESKRLSQKMFEDITFTGLKNDQLALDTERIYQENNHPKGSQISHDSTGLGINLNANNTINPGINMIKNNQTIYGLNVRSNIRNYVPGPLGIPTLDVNNFEYATENLILENLIKDSVLKGKYLATLLYHGTGGLIYYKPHQALMNDKTYQDFLTFNEELANIYHNDTDYKLLKESDFTGYGDYLRRTYKGVLLIELSKMGGNPLGPYGDPNNTYEVFDKNSKALSSVIKTLTKRK